MSKLIRNILALALLLTSPLTLAEKITGTLNRVSFSEHFIQVDNETLEVNTDYTRVIYHGDTVGEESLRPGDQVELIISDDTGANQRRDLHTVILLRGSKSGLDR